MSRDGPGRSTKLTPEREAVILETLKAGGTWEAAAAGAGITAATIHEWRRRGIGEEPRGLGDPDGIYAEFVDRCTRAVDDGERLAVQAVMSAFTLPTTTTTTKTFTGPDGQPVTETTERVDPPDAMMALRWLERRRAKGWSPKNILEHQGMPKPSDGPREVRITLVEPERKPD